MEAMKRNGDHQSSSSTPAPVIRSEDFPSLASNGHSSHHNQRDAVGNKRASPVPPDGMIPIAPVLPWVAAMSSQSQQVGYIRSMLLLLLT